jgi:uncharacterized protein
VRTHKSAVLAGALVLGLIATGCGGKRNDAPAAQPPPSGQQIACESSDGRITIATGNTGGVYYTLGGGLAQLISDNTKLRATAAETTASVQNIQQLVKGDYDVAFSLADTAADAVEGKGSFQGKQNVMALARIYSNYTHVVVRSSSGINSVADFKGKKISTGGPNSGTEVIAKRLIQAAGLAEGDVQAQRLAIRPTVDGMKAGQIDGLVWSGGIPTPEITDLFTSMGSDVKFIDITPLLDNMKKVNLVYDKANIPSATYKSLPGDVPTIVVPNVLLVRDNFTSGNACAITKLIFDKKDDLAKVHPSAKELSRDLAAKTDPVPLHPGAKQALSAT